MFPGRGETIHALADKMNPAAKSAVRFGTAITALIALLPYLTDFFLTAYVAGALAAVWFAVRIGHERLSYTDGAQLGFLSGFYGLLAASAVYDLLWKVFHYQLWRIQNADRMIALFSDMLRDAFSLSVWFLFILQIVTAAILAGAFAAPSGILAVKLFQPCVTQ